MLERNLESPKPKKSWDNAIGGLITTAGLLLIAPLAAELLDYGMKKAIELTSRVPYNRDGPEEVVFWPGPPRTLYGAEVTASIATPEQKAFIKELLRGSKTNYNPGTNFQ